MDYKTWKKTKENNNSTNFERLETLKKQYGFEMVEENNGAQKCIIGGVCNTPLCENTYRKQFRCINTTGPYCDKCAGINKRKGLLIDEFPEIANSIISDVDLTKITSCSGLKVKFECSQSCSRCKKKHVWNAMIANRVKGNGCGLCANFLDCQCVNEEIEFCCYKCRKIKPLNEKCVSYRLCTLCRRKEADGNFKKHLKLLFNCTSKIMITDPRKKGDLTFEYLEQLYEKQEGKCYISGIKMNAGTHQNWKMSIERVDENLGYMNTNCVLICAEFQSGCRQHTKENWDTLCSLVQGNLTDIPDEMEYLIEYVKESKIPKTKIRQKRQINNNGQTRCNVCHMWLDNNCFTKGNKTNCRKCLAKMDKIRNGTMKRRFSLLIRCSKHSAKKRKGDAKEHTITIDYIYSLYFKQKGRCYYTNIPLTMGGHFQISIERINVKKGYIETNVVLIILGLNVGDHSGMKKKDDDRDGFSGWNREKILWAVEQNPRNIIPKMTTIKEFLSN
jgi:hypothetical protein